MEIHSEEIQISGLLIKIVVSLDQATRKYSVLCKAFDEGRALVWQTKLLGEKGEPLEFDTLPEAIAKARNVFHKDKSEK